MRLVLDQLVRWDLNRLHAIRGLLPAGVTQPGKARLRRGDDDAALGLVLEATDLGGDSLPKPDREPGQVELGSGQLVGDQDVALTGPGGAASHGPSVQHRDAQAGLHGMPGTRSAQDASADDGDICAGGRRRWWHAGNVSHSNNGTRGVGGVPQLLPNRDVPITHSGPSRLLLSQDPTGVRPDGTQLCEVGKCEPRGCHAGSLPSRPLLPAPWCWFRAVATTTVTTVTAPRVRRAARSSSARQRTRSSWTARCSATVSRPGRPTRSSRAWSPRRRAEPRSCLPWPSRGRPARTAWSGRSTSVR